jgi:hypothetical protein
MYRAVSKDVINSEAIRHQEILAFYYFNYTEEIIQNFSWKP